MFFSSRSTIQIRGWCCVRHQHWTDLACRLWQRRNCKLWTSLHGRQFWHPGKNFGSYLLHWEVYAILSWSNITFLCNHFKSLTLLSIDRWRKHLDPHLHLLWKTSAQTQSTTSPWQPSLSKALEPSPMTYHRRPCKPVCSLLFSFLSCSLCGLDKKGIFPSEAVKRCYAFTDLNSNEVMCFFPFTGTLIFSDVNCIITFELWLCFSQTWSGFKADSEITNYITVWH